MICTRCYESNVFGDDSKPITRTNRTGVILWLAWLAMPAIGYPVVFTPNPATGAVEPSSTATLIAIIVIELILVVGAVTIGRSMLCSACHHDALIPRTTARGRLIFEEQKKAGK